MSILRQDLKFNGMIDGWVSDGGMGGGGWFSYSLLGNSIDILRHKRANLLQ